MHTVVVCYTHMGVWYAAYCRYLTSVYWTALSLGRVVGVFASVWVTAAQLISFDFSVSIIGCMILIVWGGNSLAAAYTASAFIGFALSSM